MDRRAHSSKGVEGRINACRQRLRHHRSTQRTRAVVRQAAALREEDEAAFELENAPRMSSIAEILSGAGIGAGWLERGAAREVDGGGPRRTGLSVQEEELSVKEEVGTR